MAVKTPPWKVKPELTVINQSNYRPPRISIPEHRWESVSERRLSFRCFILLFIFFLSRRSASLFSSVGGDGLSLSLSITRSSFLPFLSDGPCKDGAVNHRQAFPESWEATSVLGEGLEQWLLLSHMSVCVERFCGQCVSLLIKSILWFWKELKGGTQMVEIIELIEYSGAASGHLDPVLWVKCFFFSFFFKRIISIYYNLGLIFKGFNITSVIYCNTWLYCYHSVVSISYSLETRSQ